MYLGQASHFYRNSTFPINNCDKMILFIPNHGMKWFDKILSYCIMFLPSSFRMNIRSLSMYDLSITYFATIDQFHLREDIWHWVRHIKTSFKNSRSWFVFFFQSILDYHRNRLCDLTECFFSNLKNFTKFLTSISF